MAQKFPTPLTALIAHLKKLPGVGARTAERFAFELLSWDGASLTAFSENLATLKENLPLCKTCGCLTDGSACKFCTARDTHALCIIASARDAYAIEQTHAYKGMYHVIEHLISPLDGRNLAHLRIDRIEARIREKGVKELIIALDSTLEGDTTALYLHKTLAHENLSISRLAFGLPVGSSLEYIDANTLLRAFSGRQSYNTT